MGLITIEPERTVKPTFSAEANSLNYAQSLDEEDQLRSFRSKFIIPSKTSLKSMKLSKPDPSDEPCIYFCGNSLGIQPRSTAEYIHVYLDTWATLGLQGHFRKLENSPMFQWQLLAEQVSEAIAPIVGASALEVGTMGTLTMNLHLLLGSFYLPTKEKSKIIMDWKSFPSDHFTFESQIRGHGYDPEESMVMIAPDEGEYEISTEKILSIIDEHAATTALVLLPGIQYYTGQFFDIKTITAYAQSKGLLVGWDLAHAVGNVPLQLREWNVDFAVWCTYKYMNAGPGAIAGFYVHEAHGKVEYEDGKPIFRHRLSGWYGGNQEGRLDMENYFRPSTGASGYQLSNPSAVNLASLSAAISIFSQTSIADIRKKSVKLTAYLEHLLLTTSDADRAFSIITPSNPDARGAQLSLLLKPGRVDSLFEVLEDEGIVVDKRQPDVIRVAPVPLYNTYEEVWKFVQIFNATLSLSTSIARKTK